MAYTSSKTDWEESYDPSVEDFNRIEGNIKAIQEEANSFDGNKTFNNDVDVQGDLTGVDATFSGDITGDLTGSVTGNLSGASVTVTASIQSPYIYYSHNALGSDPETWLHSTSAVGEAALWTFLSDIMTNVNTAARTYIYHLNGGFDSTKIVSRATRISSTTIRLYWFQPSAGLAGQTDITSTGSDSFGQLSLCFT